MNRTLLFSIFRESASMVAFSSPIRSSYRRISSESADARPIQLIEPGREGGFEIGVDNGVRGAAIDLVGSGSQLRAGALAFVLPVHGKPHVSVGDHAGEQIADASAPDVRGKWMQTSKLAGYPEFLWPQPDTGIDGWVAGRRAVSSSQMATGTVIFGRWSDAIIASWAGVEILVNPYVRAIQAENLIKLDLFTAIAFRYSSAIVSSSDSASQ